MKTKTLFLISFIILGCVNFSFSQKGKKKAKAKAKAMAIAEEQNQNSMTHTDSVSYAFGIVLGHNLKAEEVYDLNLDVLRDAIHDVLTKEEFAISGQEARTIVNQHIEAKRKEKFARNLAEGEAFLATNKEKEGIVETASGLQYEIMVEGDGEKPGLQDKVRTHYHGTLLDGTVFDSSVQRNEPAEFPLNGVIKGWTEALQLMSVGSKWRLFIPPGLAYGEHGAGKKIGPNATLIFEVELLDIIK